MSALLDWWRRRPGWMEWPLTTRRELRRCGHNAFMLGVDCGARNYVVAGDRVIDLRNLPPGVVGFEIPPR